MGNEIKKCVIISGAPENDISYYNEHIADRYVICADSGYIKCLSAGIKPDLIIADFDSSPRPDIECEIITLNVRKDYTDTFHCVLEAIDRGYHDIIILGGIGSRLDHTYSNILSVNYAFENNVSCALISKNCKITIESGCVKIKKGKYKYFSLFPLFEECVGLSIKGAEYELDHANLLPSNQLTQSNAFKDDLVTIDIKKGKIILFLCND